MADAPGGPLRDAIGALIDAGGEGPRDAGNAPILKPQWPRFYRGSAEVQDDGAGNLTWPDPGYFDLAADDEGEAGCYNQEFGQDVVQRIRCWGRTPEDTQRLHQWLKQRLHGAVLVVQGYRDVQLQFSRKIGPLSDPDRSAYQVAADYTTEAMEAAA